MGPTHAEHFKTNKQVFLNSVWGAAMLIACSSCIKHKTRTNDSVRVWAFACCKSMKYTFFVLRRKACSEATLGKNRSGTYTERVLAYIINIQWQNMIFAAHIDPILIFIHE